MFSILFTSIFITLASRWGDDSCYGIVQEVWFSQCATGAINGIPILIIKSQHCFAKDYYYHNIIITWWHKLL